MTFEGVLDQALAMLQRRGRVTYQTFQLQFELNDNRLSALKDALLFAHPDITDEGGLGLVWTGKPPYPPQYTQPATDSESRLQIICLLVMQQLQRERLITYRALKHRLGIERKGKRI